MQQETGSAVKVKEFNALGQYVTWNRAILREFLICNVRLKIDFTNRRVLVSLLNGVTPDS